MNKMKWILVLAAGTFGVITGFQNCSGGSMPDVQTATKTSTTSMSVTIFPAVIGTSDSAATQVYGGTPPYTYKILQGPATVDTSGVVRASGQGAAIVQVTDATGAIAVSAVSIGTVAGSTGKACTTAWGASVADGATVVGFGTASVDCPGSCTPVTVACVNGNLVGGAASAASCSVVSCQWKPDYFFGCPLSIPAEPQNLPTIPTSYPTTCTAQQYHTRTCNWGQIPGNQLTNIQTEYLCASPSETVPYQVYSGQ